MSIKVTSHDVMNEARKVIIALRPEINATLDTVSKGWRARMIDELGARLCDPATMTMDEMSKVFDAIYAALADMRLESDIVVHTDERCYELNAGSVLL